MSHMLSDARRSSSRDTRRPAADIGAHQLAQLLSMLPVGRPFASDKRCGPPADLGVHQLAKLLFGAPEATVPLVN